MEIEKICPGCRVIHATTIDSASREAERAMDIGRKFPRISEEQARALEEAIDRRPFNGKCARDRREAVALVQRTLLESQEGWIGRWIINTYMALLVGSMGLWILFMLAVIFRGAIALSDYVWKLCPWCFA